MRQRRWIELVKDYDRDISYHPSKVNVFANALSRNETVLAYLSVHKPLQVKIQRFDLEVYARGDAPNLVTLTVLSTLRDIIRAGQSNDEQLQKWRQRDESKGSMLYSVEDGIVSTKMYKDLQLVYWWLGMKRDIMHFVSECLTCQQVKAEHQRQTGMLRLLPIPEWK
ncbi:uncharacterized protein [Primulina huaijiensis]|uniref:uncharacterized protein n=1 Tax=Primulina huaijiensis TaxID=1492673 RepID=UPI003CC76200